MSDIKIEMQEWERRSPDPGSPLCSVFLADEPSVRNTAAMLNESGVLEIAELARGLSIRSSSYVGTVNIGSIRISIHPKIKGIPLISLMRYAYRLRQLNLFPSSSLNLDKFGFHDILINQLILEATELLTRGLHRNYLRVDQKLATLQGRINFQQMVRQGGLSGTTLACIHHPRIEDCLTNQVLLSGLLLSVNITDDLALKAKLRRLTKILYETLSPVSLNYEPLQLVKRQMNRLTSAYECAIGLIELLHNSTGVTLETAKDATERLPGFLFDMNHFFQALISRFLRDNLNTYELKDEHRLKDIFLYLPEWNPLKRAAPTPRPDYVVSKHGEIVSVIDAKYRNLWQESLPRDMLYQLAIYATSQKDLHQSIILYPSLDEDQAKEARIEIRDPIYGGRRAQVILRPVNLEELERRISRADNRQNERMLSKYAHRLVFGDNPQEKLANSLNGYSICLTSACTRIAR